MERYNGRRRLRGRLISRRRLLVQATGGSLALAEAGAVSCGRSSGTGKQAPSTPANAGGQPTRGGYFHHLVAYSAVSIDPYATEDATAYTFIEEDWYEPLVRIDYTPAVDWRIANKVIPWLADRFERVDPITYTFHVRPGVRFHNGDGLTSQDAVFSYNRLIDPALKANPATARYVENLARMEAPDAETLRITTKRPDADFLPGLALQRMVIVSRKWVENGGDLTKSAVGTGPFKLMSYQKDSNGLAVRFQARLCPNQGAVKRRKRVCRRGGRTTRAEFQPSRPASVTVQKR